MEEKRGERRGDAKAHEKRSASNRPNLKMGLKVNLDLMGHSFSDSSLQIAKVRFLLALMARLQRLQQSYKFKLKPR
jgi:hypothetical protein